MQVYRDVPERPLPALAAGRYPGWLAALTSYGRMPVGVGCCGLFYMTFFPDVPYSALTCLAVRLSEQNRAVFLVERVIDDGRDFLVARGDGEQVVVVPCKEVCLAGKSPAGAHVRRCELRL